MLNWVYIHSLSLCCWACCVFFSMKMNKGHAIPYHRVLYMYIILYELILLFVRFVASYIPDCECSFSVEWNCPTFCHTQNIKWNETSIWIWTWVVIFLCVWLFNAMSMQLSIFIHIQTCTHTNHTHAATQFLIRFSFIPFIHLYLAYVIEINHPLNDKTMKI